MPICPNCESAIEYKGGMVCPRCNFDFKRYWFVPWKLLQFKFQEDQRTPVKVAMILVWMFVPPLVCAAICVAMFEKGILLLWLPLGMFTVAVSVLFTVFPFLALMKKDHLRDFNVDAPNEDA